MDEQEQNNNEGVFLRTVLRKDVFDIFTEYAKSLSTGMDKWDYGVAIERLLDMAQIDERISVIERRLELIESEQFIKEEQPKINPKKAEDIEDDKLLGKHHIKDKSEEDIK